MRDSPSGADLADGRFATLGRLIPYLWPAGDADSKLRVVAALFLILASKGALVLVPLFYKDAVDALSVDPAALSAIPLAAILGYGLARFGNQAFTHLRDAIFARVGYRALRAVALDVFRHLHAQSLAFHLARQTGSLSRALDRGTSAITRLLSILLFNIGPTAIEIVLTFAILWAVLGLDFALIVACTLGAYVGYTLKVTEWRLAFRRRMNEASEAGGQKQIDSLLNHETVKYFTNEAFEAERYRQTLERYEEAGVRNESSLALLNLGQGAIIAAGATALMWMAARGVVAGSMTVGDLVLAITYMGQIAAPLGVFGWVYREIRQALVDMGRMFDLLDQPVEVRDRRDAADLRCTQGGVMFRGVSFRYEPERPILDHVDFAIPPGGSLAVVGPTGSGKSTLARLLCRFYDVEAGAILIDGQDIRHVTQASLRRHIGVVPQDTVLFNDTLAYNIGYARPGVGRAEIERAARLAHIHDFITSLPRGYETVVGERGLKLSGGEKQRVAIARAFLKDPPVLILDEATSALDSATEAQIQANLRELGQGRTTLTIAHRLSTIIDADRIVVMEAGRVREQGSHGELLQQGGVYAGLWTRQAADREGGLAAPIDKLRPAVL